MSAVVTRLLRVGPDPARDPGVAEAARLLRAGELVAFPTETVYGLGADAASPRAVEKVYEAKGRPSDNPLIVHLASAAALPSACERVDPRAEALARAFWPGPLTLVLPARDELRAACRGLPTVAVRVPDHPVALALLEKAAIPVAAPSANVSGRPSPTRAEDVLADLGGRIPLVLDGGPCRVGLESTVLDLSGPPVILRPGAVTAEEIEAVMGESVGAEADADALRRSPGTRHRHYAPRPPVLLLGSRVAPTAARALVAALGRVGYIGDRPELLELPEVLAARGIGSDPVARARGLHAALRDLDAAGVDAIVADAPEARGLGRALLDRLRRAAAHVVEDDEAALRLSRGTPPAR